MRSGVRTAHHFIAEADRRDVCRISIAHPEGLAWLSLERDNLRAALEWTEEVGACFTGDDERALDHFIELLELTTDNDALMAAINADAGEILIHRGRLDEAEVHLRESLALGGGVRAKASLAELALARGDYDSAQNLAREAEVGFRGVDAYNLMAAQEIHGETARRRGDLDEARTWFVVAARGAGDLGDKGLAADCLDGLAAVAADEGDVVEADRISRIAAALRDAAGVVPYRPERVRGVDLVPYGISLEEAIAETIGLQP